MLSWLLDPWIRCKPYHDLDSGTIAQTRQIKWGKRFANSLRTDSRDLAGTEYLLPMYYSKSSEVPSKSGQVDL